MSRPLLESFEWLEADGLGGFASGTATGIRTRRYHGLLLVAATPPTGRVVLVNGFDAWLETPFGRYAITSQCYAPDALHPDGAQRIESFELEPWPRWIFELEDGTRVAQELFVPRGRAACVLSWRLLEPRDGCRLAVRPFISGRDYHGLHHENLVLRFDSAIEGEQVTWHTYGSLPAISMSSNGTFAAEPFWYENFIYREERERGQDFREDLAAPGVVTFDLSRDEAVCIFATDTERRSLLHGVKNVRACVHDLRTSEKRRRKQFESPLHHAADAFIVARGAGRTILAGYPWFTDWGRDTFIAMRGLTLATGRLDDAREILLEWAGSVSNGMLPNRFPDRGAAPDYNAVDASLWFVIVVGEFLAECERQRTRLTAKQREVLERAAKLVIEGYAHGTRFGIRLDDDGLIAAGVPGVQLTWMDAKVDDHVITPRIGKPVEIQALWINALATVARFDHGAREWRETFERAVTSFSARYWNPERRALFDVIDVDHVAGANDASLRPNQLFAVGGLPLAVLTGVRARAVVDTLERELWTPLGPRSLAPGDANYHGTYAGGVLERDRAYHQGTVWPWLAGAFIEAWVRVRESTPAAKREARERFLEPLLARAHARGGHLHEIADGDAPHEPRGAPFQAWSVGELLRVQRVLDSTR